tara:strand:- start:1342 stop:1782 length:441 start_codon:yes stop_codon:yes gene_type:complete
MQNIQTIIGSDHAGFELKLKIIKYRFKKKITFCDVGTFTKESVDYPDYGKLVAQKVDNGKFLKGILICGSGVGMSIVANRFKNVRAALCIDENMAKLSRQHNDANIIVLGSRLISFEQAIKCLEGFFFTNFEKGRHIARINKLNNR